MGMAAALLLFILAGCLPAATVGTLEPTLTMEDVAGVEVAMQNGMPVPTYSRQPRPRIDLDGEWRVDRVELDPLLTMASRDRSLPAIEDEAGGRHLADYTDTDWERLPVPGTTNEPPRDPEIGTWYRRSFAVPRSWGGDAVTLRFGSANYVADVWLNGTWIGYHEGGSTPFAFELGSELRPGEMNTLAVRVHTIPLGTRSDVLPWGLVDWWNYGGLTGPVWLEAAPTAFLARADVTPHLDSLDVGVVLHRSDRPAGVAEPEPLEPDPARLRVSIFPASVDEGNLLDPDPRALVPDLDDPLVVLRQDTVLPATGATRTERLSLLFGDADEWTPQRPALYVLRVEVLPERAGFVPAGSDPIDELWTTFGIRHVAVDPIRPRVLLNGEPAFFRGVGLHAETLEYSADGDVAGGTPYQAPEHVLSELEDAQAIGADLIRTGHLPGDPTMLMLADRLGFAVWEEIPLYHATPLIFDRSMRRGIPQQMLREMALRDMNHPSVLFHGFANEATGVEGRIDALAELHEIDRAIDGTRLTGQAAYGWQPGDASQAPLDVAGYTMYYGVFYGDKPGPDTRRALREAHEAHPTKPILALEFGRWADLPFDEERQKIIFEETYRALEQYRADRPGGFVSAATWWTLHDFSTQLGGIGLEHFGLYHPDRSLRPAGISALDTLSADAGEGDELMLDPELERPRVRPAREVGDWALIGYLAYGIGLSVGLMGVTLVLLTRRGGRLTGIRR